MEGIGVMWMPPSTTVPPFLRFRSAAGTSSPAGAKMIAAFSFSGGAESVEPQGPAGSDSRDAQTAKPNNAGAQQRRRVQIAESFRDAIHEVFGRGDVFGVPAVDGVAGESRGVAKILHPGAAVFAGAVGRVQPSNPHASSGKKAMGLRPV